MNALNSRPSINTTFLSSFSSTIAIKTFVFCVALVVLILTQGSCAFLKYPRSGIYLIPTGYVGDVINLFEQPDGVELESEWGLFVYRIPEDGLLKVKDKGYTGIVNLSYYYLDANGGREKLPYLQIMGERSPQGLPQNKYGNISTDEYENRVYVMNAGGLGSFNTKKGRVQFTSFIVGTPKKSEQDHLYSKKQDRLFEIQRKMTAEASK